MLTSFCTPIPASKTHFSGPQFFKLITLTFLETRLVTKIIHDQVRLLSNRTVQEPRFSIYTREPTFFPQEILVTEILHLPTS